MKQLRFKPDHVPMIMAGLKTETRRSAVDIEAGGLFEAWVEEPGSSQTCGFCWGSGADPVQESACRWCAGTGKTPHLPFAELVALRVWEQRICDFSDDDAAAEGYEKAENLWDALLEFYGELDLGKTMIAVRFKVERSMIPRSAEEAMVVYERRRLELRQRS